MSPTARQTFQTFLIFGILAALGALVFRSMERPRNDLPAGLTLKELELAPLANGAKPLAIADLKGKVVLINFWGTWCPPCLKEFPHVEALAKQYRDRNDFVLLSVSCGSDGVPEDIDGLREATEGFASLAGYKIPIYADPSGRTRLGLGKAFEHYYPTNVLIDRDGTIVGSWSGFTEAEFDGIKLRVAAEMGKGK